MDPYNSYKKVTCHMSIMKMKRYIPLSVDETHRVCVGSPEMAGKRDIYQAAALSKLKFRYIVIDLLRNRD